MKHATESDFGRPVTAGQMNSTLCDKWEVINHLTAAAPVLELSHTTIGVLKALVSFLPQRTIGTDPRGHTVFPSNRTLSHRLGGMPESTLRRHLAKLVGCGLVSRRSSASGKRYARNLGKPGEVAFGFDLTPLAQLFQQIRDQAQIAQEEAEALRALRDVVAGLLRDVVDRFGLSASTEDIRRMLRRKPVRSVLEAARDALEARLVPSAPEKMNASDNQNERHIQVKSKYTSEEVRTPFHDIPVQNTPVQKKETGVHVQRAIAPFTEFHSYYPDQVRHWSDLVRLATAIAPMIGIDTPVVRDAVQRIGAEATAIAIIAILENLGTITNPGGYLRRLAQNEAGRGFALIETLVKRQKNRRLSADNLENLEMSVC